MHNPPKFAVQSGTPAKRTLGELTTTLFHQDSLAHSLAHLINQPRAGNLNCEFSFDLIPHQTHCALVFLLQMPTNTSISSTFVLSSLLSSVTSWARPPKGVSLSRNLSRVSGAIVVVLMVSTMLISSVQARVVPQYLRSVPESSYKIHHHKHHNHQQRHHQYGSSQAQKLTSLGRSGIWVNLAIPANTEIPKPPPPPPTTTLPPMAPTTSTQQPDLSR